MRINMQTGKWTMTMAKGNASVTKKMLLDAHYFIAAETVCIDKR